MRLTNYIRDAFITAVMADVPSVDYAIEAEKIARAEAERLFKLDFPTVDLNNDKIAKWFDDGTIDIPGSFSGIYVKARTEYYMLREKSPEVWEQLKVLSIKEDVQSSERGALRRKLHGVAYSCRTLKQLQDLLPEFKSYMIEDKKQPVAKYLPAVANVVAEFTKAGWPKQETAK